MIQTISPWQDKDFLKSVHIVPDMQVEAAPVDRCRPRTYALLALFVLMFWTVVGAVAVEMFR